LCGRSSWGLSEEYGFTDVDGARPHWWRYFSENFPQMAGAKPNTSFRWTLEKRVEDGVNGVSTRAGRTWAERR
jgi:hypothetical protein